MPKISVYLPDDLAERVREAQLPVSSICQAALLETLRQMSAAAYASAGSAAALPVGVEIESLAVTHFVDAVNLAYDAASKRGAATVGTEDLLQGILDEGESVMLQTLEAIGVGSEDIRHQLTMLVQGGDPLLPGTPQALSKRARRVVGRADQEAVGAGRPVNVAHLLLALIDDGGGGASRALGQAGLDMAAAQKTIAAMQSGLTFGRAQALGPPLADVHLTEIKERLDRIEKRLEGGRWSPGEAP
jgi:ATP-dependent Clp protease ATP-binding subunit ClpA